MSDKLKSVLCIDDDPDILEITKMCLETVGGLTVTCCNSGTEGVTRARQIKPDLIMVDMMMPDMDGSATLREIRKYAELGRTPVVFMTARIQPAEVAEYLNMGAAAVVAKPFDPMNISDEIQNIWKKHHGK